MLQIKTIYTRSADAFDQDVNKALADGWTLTRRTFDPNGFLAEMERVVITEAERCCDNCKYCDKPATVPPCSVCEDASKWEALEG